MSEATWEEKFRFMQSEYDRLLPAYMEAKAENDRLRAQLAEAEADKLAAVKRAIERTAVACDQTAIRVLKCGYDDGGLTLSNAADAIRALPADEIANLLEQSK